MPFRHKRSAWSGCLLLLLSAPSPTPGQNYGTPASASYGSSDLANVDEIGVSPSRLRPWIERFSADRGALTRKYPLEMSSFRRERMKEFYREWLNRIEAMGFDGLKQADRIDYLLFRNYLHHQLRQLDLDAKSQEEVAPLVPFAPVVLALDESCRRMEAVDGAKAAAALHGLVRQIETARKNLEASIPKAGNPQASIPKASIPNDRPASITESAQKTLAWRAALASEGLRATLKHWFDFYNGYDPVFTWWVAEPYKAADSALQAYQSFLRERIVGMKPGDSEAIVGHPIGREALLSELAHEMIPYTPEELMAIANREFAWCENEMKRASRELGYGDDWQRALEYVKTLHEPPGKQPELIRRLALEAEAFLDEHNLITIPKLAGETWRMEMMPPQRQLVNPFFTGGEVISVSYPTAGMTEEQKLMSMRGNNIHFSRATVFHELIPGHHLQTFMGARYRPDRILFATPFSTEGWALYWELLLWDLNFAKSPENRIGMLFWRMHRCARIIFSLGFHLQTMTPQECIDFLVNRVGHERDNAAGEVRRSFNGSYPPLYQAAYLLGGLQIYALHRELVGSGKMTNRQFHDAILLENRIPIEMLRASLTNQKLTRDFVSTWRFYEGKF